MCVVLANAFDCCFPMAARVHWCGRPGEVVTGRVLIAHWLVLTEEIGCCCTGGCVGVGGAGREEGGGAAASNSVRVSCGMSGLCVWVCLVVRVGLCRPPSSFWADALQVCGACEDKSPCECHVYLRRAWCVSGGVSLLPLLCLFSLYFSLSFCCT